MPMVNMRDLMKHAYNHGYAVASFDLVSLKFLKGVLAAAERCRAPVILSISEPNFDIVEFELIVAAMETTAAQASIPVALHFDHCAEYENAVHAIARGCNSLMVDASDRTLIDNINLTRKMVEMAHSCGVAVEAELGYVPGTEGTDGDQYLDQISYTTVAEAKAYVQRTGVDCLAVSIGTVHGRTKVKPKLDWTRLKQLKDALGIPLVIHGGTGLADDQFARLISNGVAKINYFTGVSDAARARVQSNAKTKSRGSYLDMMDGVQEAVSQEAERCMRMCGSAGRAAEILAQCALWTNVQELMVVSTDVMDSQRVEQHLADARAELLHSLPGLRSIELTRSIRESAQVEKFVWMASVSHPQVLESCHDHPAWRKLTDQLIRIIGAECITVEVQPLTQGPAPAPVITSGFRPRQVP